MFSPISTNMRRLFSSLAALALMAVPAAAQQKTVTGKVTTEAGAPVAGVSVVVRGTNLGVLTNTDGNYSIRASVGQVLQYRFIGTAPEERTIGAADVINVQLRRVASNLDAIVVTALGQTAQQRALGTAQQTVSGADIAGAQRENFINALQGRVAGVEVTSSSGAPGASTMITIRGISSISSNNQPLFIIDGLPLDNKTMDTENATAFDVPNSSLGYANRGVDFTNRAADVNPEDIESIVVLKGPEAAALYGIDAANGAVVITTKRGKLGSGGFDYSVTYRVEGPRSLPEVQHAYGPSGFTTGPYGTNASFVYFGAPYAPGTTFYDNVGGFFRTAASVNHNLAFSGASGDSRIRYRAASSYQKRGGVIPGSLYNRINVTGASTAQVNNWLNTDLSMQYAYDNNDLPFKGDNGVLLDLLLWPSTDNAKDYLTPAGTRRRLSLTSATEIDNPYFSIAKNKNNQKTNRIITNFGAVLTPVSWASLKTNIGADNYASEYTLLRHPESAFGLTQNGILDITNDVTRNISAQTVLTFNGRNVGDFGPVGRMLGSVGQQLNLSGFVGNQVIDYKTTYEAVGGTNFLDPNFVSINNTDITKRTGHSTIVQRRLVGAFAQATLAYNKYLYLNLTGRNDWTSTIPKGRNSFFYPSVSGSFIFSDAFPSVGRYMTGKLRAAYAEVGKDARPYSYAATLESKTTTGGGYGYTFWGPNAELRPEFATSREFGTETNYLDGRLGLDVTWYRKQTKDQIVQNIRGSYGTGFILFNLNGAVTRNDGWEITGRATPVERRNLSWDVLANFDHSHGVTLALPNALPESYNADTWLFGNVRNGTAPGLSTRSLTGFYYQRNKDCELLIDPTTGIPLRQSVFVDAKCVNSKGETMIKGYDRQPAFTLGLTNTVKYGSLTLSGLVDIRRGGDVFNATEHSLAARGLSNFTLDREKPRVIPGILRDGKENTDNPTRNTIVVTPAANPNYYVNISEELFIERDINWLRVRDVTLTYALPARLGNNSSVFVTGTDLYLRTNYSGLDPIVNGNTAAVGGSSAAGIDYGNFPMPRAINFGFKTRF
jgi:TonB-linked SusC/RagA family outer membrane protein